MSVADHSLGGGVSAKTTSSASIAAPPIEIGASRAMSMSKTSAASDPVAERNQTHALNRNHRRSLLAVLEASWSTLLDAAVAVLCALWLLDKAGLPDISQQSFAMPVRTFAVAIIATVTVAAALHISLMAARWWAAARPGSREEAGE